MDTWYLRAEAHICGFPTMHQVFRYPCWEVGRVYPLNRRGLWGAEPLIKYRVKGEGSGGDRAHALSPPVRTRPSFIYIRISMYPYVHISISSISTHINPYPFISIQLHPNLCKSMRISGDHRTSTKTNHVRKANQHQQPQSFRIPGNRHNYLRLQAK